MAAEDPESALVGHVLANKYRIDRLLGVGGMGAVYKAENTALGRVVAIKTLKSEHAASADVVARFLREASAANLVRHPHVVDVLDIGTDERAGPFIVQELLEGEDLGKFCERRGGVVDVDTLLDILVPVVEAVGFAHSRGVVHRDLKPENIFLARVNEKLVPKLLDFGISQVRTKDQARMTVTTAAMGSPAYMSPEQIQNAATVDARTDVWALGMVLYESLLGQYPYQAESVGALFVEISTRDLPPLASVAKHVPTEVSRIVMRCLRRKREDRYASAAELARDLANVREGLDAEPTGKFSIPPAAPQTAKALDIPDLDLAPPSRAKVAVPDLALPTGGKPAESKPKRPAGGAGLNLALAIERTGTEMLEGGYVKQEGSGLQLAVDPREPAPMSQRRGAAAIANVRRATAVEKFVLGPIGVLLPLAGAFVGAMQAIPHATPWPLLAWFAPVVDGANTKLAMMIGGASIAFGVVLLVFALKRERKLWGYLLASIFAIVFGAIAGFPSFVAKAAAEDAMASGPPRMTVALLGATVGIFALGSIHAAFVAWSEFAWWKRIVGSIAAALAGICMFVGYEMILAAFV
ncbi:MAG: serine/threonine-protein kinase [Polyangiaceae bacterium]